ncbi:MAG: iron-sulfur cluster assembly accessory protein [Alphaproteobacteria bacterium]
MNKAVITIHPDVVAYVREKVAATAALDPTQQVVGLWVEVTKKGCSGHSYDFAVMTAAKLAEYAALGKFDQPEKVAQDGVTVFIEPQSVLKVIGAELVLERDAFAARLNFRNPNAKGHCGCGESFALETPPN